MAAGEIGHGLCGTRVETGSKVLTQMTYQPMDIDTLTQKMIQMWPELFNFCFGLCLFLPTTWLATLAIITHMRLT